MCILRKRVTVGYLLCPRHKPTTKLLDSYYCGACGFVLTANPKVSFNCCHQAIALGNSVITRQLEQPAATNF